MAEIVLFRWPNHHTQNASSPRRRQENSNLASKTATTPPILHWIGGVWVLTSWPSWSSNHGGAFVLKIGGSTITSIIQNKKPVSELFSLVCRSRPKTKSRSSSKTPLAALSHHDRRALPRALPSLTRRLPRHPDCPHSARNAPLAAALSCVGELCCHTALPQSNSCITPPATISRPTRAHADKRLALPL